MMVVPDDEIYRVDEVFLGPDRFRFPWRWSYRQYGVAVITFLALQGLERQIGIPIGIWPVLFAGLITVMVTRWVQDGINWDRGIKVVVRELSLEITGPRETTKTIRTALTVARAGRHRPTVIDSTSPDEDAVTPPPSWWSQFKITKKKTKKKSKQTSRKNVDTVRGGCK